MEVNHKIENLDQVLTHLLRNSHRQAYAIETLWLKAGYSMKELRQVIKNADLAVERERLKRSFLKEGEE